MQCNENSSRGQKMNRDGMHKWGNLEVGIFNADMYLKTRTKNPATARSSSSEILNGGKSSVQRQVAANGRHFEKPNSNLKGRKLGWRCPCSTKKATATVDSLLDKSSNSSPIMAAERRFSASSMPRKLNENPMFLNGKQSRAFKSAKAGAASRECIGFNFPALHGTSGSSSSYQESSGFGPPSTEKKHSIDTTETSSSFSFPRISTCSQHSDLALQFFRRNGSNVVCEAELSHDEYTSDSSSDLFEIQSISTDQGSVKRAVHPCD